MRIHLPVLVTCRFLELEQAKRKESTMNYIAEMKAFYDRLEVNPLPSPAIALWHALMSIANKTGWQQEFTVASSILMLKSGLNAQAIKRARNRLAQEGFLTWRSRGGNQSAVYHLNSLVVQNDNKNVPQFVPQADPQSVPQNEQKTFVVQNNMENVPQFVPQTDPQAVPQTDPQSVPINKQKQNKTKTDRPPLSPIVQFAAFWSAYPNKQRQALTEHAYCDLLLSGTVQEEELVKSAQNYAEYVQITGEKMYLPNNFLEKRIFEDFLPSRYQKPLGNYSKPDSDQAIPNGSNRSSAEEKPTAFGSLTESEEEDVLSEEELAGEDWMKYGPGWRERHV